MIGQCCSHVGTVYDVGVVTAQTGGDSLLSSRGGFLCLCGEISAKDSIAFISTVLTFRTTDTDKFSSLRYFRIGLYLRIAYER